MIFIIEKKRNISQFYNFLINYLSIELNNNYYLSYKDIINITLNQWNIHESLFEEIFLQILFNKFCIISLLVVYQSNLLIFVVKYDQYYVNSVKYSWIIKHMGKSLYLLFLSFIFFSRHIYIFKFAISVIPHLLGNFITGKYSGKSMLML